MADDTWGKLSENEREALRAQAQTLTNTEVEDRFREEDGRVVFRVRRKTDRALAGPLDIDRAEVEEAERAARPLPVEEEFEVVEISLIPAEEFDYEPEITEEDEEAARAIDEKVQQKAFYYSRDRIGGPVERSALAEGEEAAPAPEAAGLPPAVDHRPSQSPIKNQASRGTCVSHASLALLEAYEHIPDDLSEQLVHYRFNEFLDRPQDVDAGLRTTDAPRFLADPDGRACLESEWPYMTTQGAINDLVEEGTYEPPEAALNNARFGYGANAYKIIPDRGLEGESIKNTRYLETLLDQGYNVVFGTWVSWDDKDNDGILDPVLDSDGNPIGRGGHAMLLVGYNRTEQYFIVKNSWGRGWGHDGYGHLHYNLARSCFKYGFVVDAIEPPPEGQRLPQALAQAPFSARPLHRGHLGAAILFLKTSAGRYAVCEAYAGDNLLLRNLRVYNPDGSVHLEKDALVVRGNHLCDVDAGRETRHDADFWWLNLPGIELLIPRNGAEVHLAYDVADLDAGAIEDLELSQTPIPSSDLRYAVIAGKTTADVRFKMVVQAPAAGDEENALEISYLELYNHNGRRRSYATGISVTSPWTYNLDTMRLGSSQFADVWWRVTGDDEGVLATQSDARMTLVWRL